MKTNHQISCIAHLLLTSIFLFFPQKMNWQKRDMDSSERKIQILPLLTHGGTPSAGCYIQDKKSNVYCQLLANEVYFNIDNADEMYEEIKSKAAYSKEYTYGFSNGKYNIFIKEIPLKKEGCITTSSYKITIQHKNKMFHQKLRGFCGCEKILP